MFERTCFHRGIGKFVSVPVFKEMLYLEQFYWEVFWKEKLSGRNLRRGREFRRVRKFSLRDSSIE